MIPPDYTALEREARHRANMLRERHLSVFNGSDLDEREISRMQEQHDVIAECLVKAADALALAASLQEEKAVLIADFKREESAWRAALDKSKAENQRLQEEIERLKRYAVHQNRCAKWWYHQIEAPNGQLRDGVACSCGLEADRPQCRTCKHYEPIGPSIGLCNGKWGNAAIPPVFGCEQHVEKSCGLAPETGAT